MATPNRWGVREAAEATFFNIATENAIVTLKTLKMTEVQTTGETVYARGGRGNAKILGFSSDREATVTLQDAIFDNKALAMLTGNEVEEGAKELDFFHEAIVSVSDTVELPKAPESIVSVYLLDDDGVTNKTLLSVSAGSPTITEYSLAGSTLTFHEDNSGKRVRIYYKSMTASDAKTVRVTSDRFGGTFRLVVDVLIKDEATSQDYFGQFIVPRAKIEDDFSFSFSPDGDPSVLDIPIEILKDPASTTMWELVIYG